MNTLSLFFLVAVAIGGIAWVFVYPLLSGERKAEKRQETVTKNSPVVRASAARNAPKSRREQVEGTLKEIEVRGAKARSVPLSLKIAQAGLTWSKRRFFITSGVLGAVAFLIVFMVDAGLLAAIAMGFGAAFGLPLWLLKFLKARRESKFMAAFPDAVDVIVRGIKAGLPLLDSMRIITLDSPEPVKSEFRAIVDTQAIGMPIGDACTKLSSAFQSLKRTSSGSSSKSSRRPAATCRRRSAISRKCCASARR